MCVSVFTIRMYMRVYVFTLYVPYDLNVYLCVCI